VAEDRDRIRDIDAAVVVRVGRVAASGRDSTAEEEREHADRVADVGARVAVIRNCQPQTLRSSRSSRVIGHNTGYLGKRSAFF